MVAGRLDIILEAGADFDEIWTFKDAADQGVSWSGYTAQMDGRRRVDDDNTARVFTWTSGAGNMTLGTDGTVTFDVDGAAISAYDFNAAGDRPGVGVYDLLLTNAATGKKIRAMEGKIEFRKAVSR